MHLTKQEVVTKQSLRYLSSQPKRVKLRSDHNARGKSLQNSVQIRRSTYVHKQKVPYGIIHLNSTLNNTIATLTDKDGQVLCWCSAGTLGFKGSRRSTSHAAQRVGEEIGFKTRNLGIRLVSIWCKGFGYGKESALRGLNKARLQVRLLKDITGRPYNGCRPKKRRKV